MRSYLKVISVLVALIFLFQGCVYYNLFYHVKKNFNEAEDMREKSGKDEAGRAASLYQRAVEKASVVLTDHPDSKYVDDALYIIGKSWYHLGDYGRSERKFRELLAAYPESEFYEQALFYLGKCRVQQEEYILARQAFIQVDSVTDNDKWKAEAQFMIGEIEFREGNFEQAVKYYSSYLDKYAGEESAAQVQYKIAQTYDSLERYEESKDAYMKVQNFSPDDSLYFQAFFNAGDSYYALGMIDSGYTIFENLATNERYYSHAGQIRLKLAEAQAIKGDLESAIEEYEKITKEFEKTDAAAHAYFNMGEIYLQEFDNLESARAMYDSAKVAFRRSEIYETAVERSADIARLSQFREQASAEDLEKAAESQYSLAELYLFDLNNPDTALTEFQAVIDSFPESRYAAKAYLAKGFIYKEHKRIPDSAREAFLTVLREYPSTDFVEEAAGQLAVRLDTMDIDYAGRRYEHAEKLHFEENNIDSAMIVYQSIMDDFPESKYAPKAAYAKAWLIEKFAPIEEWDPADTTSIPDSTIILAWQNVIDEYDGSAYADSARVKLGLKVTRKPPPRPQPQPDQDDVNVDADTTLIGEDRFDPSEDFMEDSTRYLLANSQYIDSLIDTLHVIDGEPTKTGEFIYPPSAYSSRFEGYVGFMIKIDFLGKPSDWRIIQSSHVKEIDEAAIESLRYTEFDVGEIPVEYIDQWQFYRIRVELPPEIKGRQ